MHFAPLKIEIKATLLLVPLRCVDGGAAAIAT